MLIELSDQQQTNPTYTPEQVIQGVTESVGAAGFTKVDLCHIQNLAVRLGPKLVRCLAEFYFELIDPGAIKMRAADMGAVAAIDETNGYVKVALLISLYLGVGSQGSTSSTTNTTSPKKDMLSRLAENVDHTRQVDGFLKVWTGVATISSEAARNARTSRAVQHT